MPTLPQGIPLLALSIAFFIILVLTAYSIFREHADKKRKAEAFRGHHRNALELHLKQNIENAVGEGGRANALTALQSHILSLEQGHRFSAMKVLVLLSRDSREPREFLLILARMEDEETLREVIQYFLNQFKEKAAYGFQGAIELLSFYEGKRSIQDLGSYRPIYR